MNLSISNVHRRLARQGLGGNTPKYRRDESDIAEGLERAMAETVPARL